MKNNTVTDDFVYWLWKESLRAWKVLNFIRGYISLMTVSLIRARMPDFAFFPPTAPIAPDIEGGWEEWSLFKFPLLRFIQLFLLRLFWVFIPCVLWELEACCHILCDIGLHNLQSTI